MVLLTTNRHGGHLPAARSDCRLVVRGAFSFLSFLLVLAFSGLNTVHAAALTTTVAVPTGSGLPFAVADFDGDHRPDLASVQTGATGVSSTDYFVRFRLSTNGRHYVHVTAPEGGLRVEVRDVNGDNAEDLVLASAWLDKPVAILLNDGHGNFSQVDPSAFSQVSRNSNTDWNSSINANISPVALSRDSSSGENSLTPRVERLLTSEEFLRFQSTRLVSVRSVALLAERAPPPAAVLL